MQKNGKPALGPLSASLWDTNPPISRVFPA
jgi:hypothetical protein